MKPGDLLFMDPSRNHFPLDRSATRHLLVAGGMGITPLLAMAQDLQRQALPLELHCFTRSVEHSAFLELLSHPRFADRAIFHWPTGPERMRDTLRLLLRERAEDDHLYLCGPKPFMDVVGQVVAGRWPPEAVHVLHFGGDPVAPQGPGKVDL
ncbi:hypothetical protein LJR290_006818 [Variovorax sp. LjRoot290]|uniref:hypothetical protein n=1 Tax=Variovorax sp. LjRoot290 TaxID=3342316 RepID=UPI003ED12DF2